LSADPVLLLADYLLDLLLDAEPERQPGVQTRREWFRDRRAQQQAMPGGLSFRGRFA